MRSPIILDVVRAALVSSALTSASSSAFIHSFIYAFYTLYPKGTWMPSKARLKQDPQKVCTWKLGCAAEISLQEVNAKTVLEMKHSSCLDSTSNFFRAWCTENVRTCTSYTLSFADEVAHSPGWPLSLRGVASGPAPRPQRWGESTAPGGPQADWRKEPFVVPTSTKTLWAPRGIEEWGFNQISGRCGNKLLGLASRDTPQCRLY